MMRAWPMLFSDGTGYDTKCIIMMIFFTVTVAVVIGDNTTSADCVQFPECGQANPNNYIIDQTEPSNPGPFHDLTILEMRELRTFLENHPNIRAEKSSSAGINCSHFFTADLWLPNKTVVLNYLDSSGPRPPRQARVVMFRGDLSPPVVQEYICGPLPNISQCKLLDYTNRRNPVEFEVRPFSDKEFETIYAKVLSQVDKNIGYILRESYNATFTECDVPSDCLLVTPTFIGTGVSRNFTSRQIWLQAHHGTAYYSVLAVDFSVLVDVSGSDTSKWSYSKVWYAGVLYESVEDLITGYNNKSIPVQRVVKPVETDDLYSTLHRRGDPWPPKPQRPPTQVEPDGKRYSLLNKEVKYMDWTFNFRLSHFYGLVLYDVKFKGERIAYELGLSEIGVIYSGATPFGQLTDYVDSSSGLGSKSKDLVPGVDCPETATLIKQAFISPDKDEPAVYDHALCLFEFNTGYPLRRHTSYYPGNSFYGGMINSALIIRAALVVENYDYILDFIFYQNGAFEGRVLSTGYILTTAYSPKENDYGFKIKENILGSLHFHMAHFKADLDILGRNNRYVTLDLKEDNSPMTAIPGLRRVKTKLVQSVKRSEHEAIVDYQFDLPKYHVVQNKDAHTQTGLHKGYRIHHIGMGKNLIPPENGNEATLSWGRYQMVVTKYKDEEFRSSSMYGFFDSGKPVVNFTSFYADNDKIEDEDLVFWISCGLHHIPHTEDIPVTPTTGNAMGFFLLPYNYFEECPSMRSRDAIYIHNMDIDKPPKGTKVDRYGNSHDQCVTPRSSDDHLLKNT